MSERKKPRSTKQKRAASKKSDDFYTSPSAISDFFSCARKYWWSRNFQAIVKSQSLVDGEHAHKILHTGKIPKGTSVRAKYYAKALAKLRVSTGYKLLSGMKELKQRIRLAPGIIMTRIMDTGGTIRGEPVIIDYKTAAEPWFTVESIDVIDGVVVSTQDPPQRTSYQAWSYLIPPDDPAPFEVWPARLDFLLSTGDIHTYRYDKADHDELIVAAIDVKLAASRDEMKYFPRNRGYACRFCQFKKPCFNAPNWEKHFKRRPIHGK